MELEKILAAEVTNTTRMNFWRDGESWRAYNRSAWFAATRFGLDAGSCRLASGGWKSVYITLSDEELDALLAPIKMVSRTAERVALDAGIPFDVNAYYKWKMPFTPGPPHKASRAPGAPAVSAVPASVPVSVQAPAPAPASDDLALQRNRDVRMRLLWQRVRDFDLRSAPPAACADFVRQLKDLVEDSLSSRP